MDKDIIRLFKERHSVRRYKPIPSEQETKHSILKFLQSLKEESDLDIRLIENSKKVFGGLLLKFAGWKQPPPAYFAFIGNGEKCGYYGEKLVIYLQSIGLNTCWIGLFNKSAAKKDTNTDVQITIAAGYGENSGNERRSKTFEQVSSYSGDAPEWFTNGVNCALLAPTAMNKQAFMIVGSGNKVEITYKEGLFSAVDLGIIKYHFEQGAGIENFIWKK